MIVPVSLGERSYDVELGEGTRRDLARVIEQRAPRARSVAIVTSRDLAKQPWFDLDSGRTQHVVYVPEGESAKTLTEFERLLEQLADLELSREDVVVGVGGGAITDVAGFAAAAFLRGVAVVHVPTSLVGQVDAAIGGKTAVNLPAAKNQVGTLMGVVAAGGASGSSIGGPTSSASRSASCATSKPSRRCPNESAWADWVRSPSVGCSKAASPTS